MQISRFAVPIHAGNVGAFLGQVMRLLEGIELAPLLVALATRELAQAGLFAPLAVTC